ncbi:prephenate dehydratase [Clostridium oryzae]|uniref:Prephenate dehydratase n=1 Tax=Clostridium oryzae TaxID=1450648 RepID=A0A1V4IMG4_9CLOT|nr:prephenate dehydratase domain-containing protein [Clostridium oryzae]OPJ61218.1 P-protein [Clostridium oryzae]
MINELELRKQLLKMGNEKIAYFGVPGSYSHEAMLNIFGEEADAIYRESFEEVFKVLVEGKVKYGVLPIENSSTGGITDVMDLLKKYDCYVVGEKCIAINHCLMGIDGAKLEDIEEVYSHTQGLLQCKEFLEQHKQWKLFDYYNTAKSAEYVKSSNSIHKAAIGGKAAAKLYGLNIIKQPINSNKENYTRFIIISKELMSFENSDKISIILNLPHVSGSLYNVIKVIYENNLNMMMIESRPIMGMPWEYSFYIDFEGNLKEERVKKAIDIIKEKSADFRLVGNYKKDM